MTTANTNNRISLPGVLFTFLGSVLFSTKAIIVKKAFYDTPIDAVTLLTLRMTFSLPFFIGIAFFASRSKDNVHLNSRQWLMLAIVGLLGYYLSSLCDFIGLKYISAGLERLILFLYPTFTLLINAAVFKQKVSRIQWIALSLTYSGIAIAYLGELSLDTSNPNFFFGCTMILLCAIFYSLYIVGSGRIIPIIGPTKFTPYAMLAATGGVFIHFLATGSYEFVTSGRSMWKYGIMLAVLSTVLPALMIANGMKRIGSNNVAIVSGIGPVATIVQAYLILGEEIFVSQLVGTSMVIAGVVLIGWRR